MFLGPGGAGKSSLKNGLMGQRFNANQKSTIVADYHQVRHFNREWVREGLVWNEVSEEDETEELAQLMVLAKQSGTRAKKYASKSRFNAKKRRHFCVI